MQTRINTNQTTLPLFPIMCGKEKEITDTIKKDVRDQKKLLEELILRWKKENEGGRIVNYISFIKIVLKEVKYEPSVISNEIIQKIYLKKRLSSRNLWPKTSLLNFLFWLSNWEDNAFKIPLNYMWTHLRSQSACADIEIEIREAFASYKIGRGRKPKEGSMKSRVDLVEAARLFILLNNPDRTIKMLSDFTQEDAEFVTDFINSKELSLLTYDKASPATYSKQLCDLKFIFKRIHQKIKTVTENVFDNCEIKKIQSAARTKVFTKSEIACLCNFGREQYSQMSIEEKFEHELSNASIHVTYEGALRAADLPVIAWEDFYNSLDQGDGVITIKIRHGKCRESDESDVLPIIYSRLKPTLDLWKNISEKYCKKYGIEPPTYEENGQTYHPIFFDENGGRLKATSCTTLVQKQCELVSIKLQKGEGAHILKHSRLTHLGAARMPRELLKVVSKHKKVEELDVYCHDDLNAAIDWLKEYDGQQNENTSNKKPIAEVTMLSVTKLCERWGRGRSQCLYRIGKLQEMGYIHPQKDKRGGVVVPTDEIEKFDEKFIGLTDAFLIAGEDDENFRKNLRKILAAKKLEGIKVGTLWFIGRKEFNDWLILRNKRRKK